MIIPIRCYTCGKVIANLTGVYEELFKLTGSSKQSLDTLGLHRYCCRRMLLTHVDIIDELLNHDYYDHKIPELTD
jgi:DNA-directed RNA polymerase I, II, and III subunit RPABC5